MNTYSLDMSGNQLRQIPTDLLITYPNVTEFNFENNNIEGSVLKRLLCGI